MQFPRKITETNNSKQHANFQSLLHQLLRNHNAEKCRKLISFPIFLEIPYTSTFLAVYEFS